MAAAPGSKPKAILYWNFEKSKELRKILKDEKLQKDFEVVFRHADKQKLASSGANATELVDQGDYLSGYGVEFLVKNVEYKTST